ncbi:MAG: PDZ domain-containing protein, partial [Pirellulales bacterium]|nr:PDZ domain-containing protein [Pirellulales bacterium]
GPSDHQSFYEVGVPVLFFFTGLHNDYHRPTDDFDKIDFGGMVRITDIVSDVALRLAIRKERPEYAETENRVQIRRQMTAFVGVTLSDRDDHVVLSGLTPGGPAERGGLRVGDRLEQLGNQPVRSSNDVLEQLRRRSPGDSLKIRVLRDGKKVDLTVRLEARPDG